MKDQMPGDWSKLEKSLKDLPTNIGRKPRAILAISGHWEEKEFTVMTSGQPPMYYDYTGFPDFAYQIRYRAPGAPEGPTRSA